MKLIRDTFVLVAEDCPAAGSEVPPTNIKPTLARLQHDFLIAAPYTMTLDDLDWAVHLAKHGVPDEERDAVRAALLARGRPCLRASPLTKRYGWGAHHDPQGRIALVPQGSARYRELADGWDGLSVVKAVRTRRATRGA